MMDENSQEQSVDAHGIQESARENLTTEHKPLDQGLGTITGSDKDASNNFQAALDRVQLLENGHRELTSLFQYVWQSIDSLVHS